MQLALEAVPITELKTGPSKLIEKLAKKPLMLTQKGKSIAVMVSPEDWNAREERLARLERLMRLQAAIDKANAGELVEYEYANPMHS